MSCTDEFCTCARHSYSSTAMADSQSLEPLIEGKGGKYQTVPQQGKCLPFYRVAVMALLLSILGVLIAGRYGNLLVSSQRVRSRSRPGRRLCIQMLCSVTRQRRTAVRPSMRLSTRILVCVYVTCSMSSICL